MSNLDDALQARKAPPGQWRVVAFDITTESYWKHTDCDKLEDAQFWARIMNGRRNQAKEEYQHIVWAVYDEQGQRVPEAQ